MGASTIIAWTKRTQNFWRGCDKVSPGCAHCYMYTEQQRYGRDPAVVVRTKPNIWRQPDAWQAEAAAAGRIDLVFTCSWSDFFHQDADAWRAEAWAIIKRTPNLHWQILTKRIDDVPARLPADWGEGYPNVWLGVSIENDAFTWRADRLRSIPARVRFLSLEPLLAPVPSLTLDGIHWVIVGGESGPGYRPMDQQWALDVEAQCARHGVEFFFKQSAAPRTEMGIELQGRIARAFPDLTVEKL